MKSYIYYKGGTWGDITATICNNGKNFGNGLKSKAVPKHILDKTPIQVLHGHAREILDYGYTNYCIIVTDQKLLEYAIKRFFIVNRVSKIELDKILRMYVHNEKLQSKIHLLNDSQKKEIIYKKFKIDKSVKQPNIKLDLSCIFYKDEYLSLLHTYFPINLETASTIYDKWYAKEKNYLTFLTS